MHTQITLTHLEMVNADIQNFFFIYLLLSLKSIMKPLRNHKQVPLRTEDHLVLSGVKWPSAFWPIVRLAQCWFSREWIHSCFHYHQITWNKIKKMIKIKCKLLEAHNVVYWVTVCCVTIPSFLSMYSYHLPPLSTQKSLLCSSHLSFISLCLQIR